MNWRRDYLGLGEDVTAVLELRPLFKSIRKSDQHGLVLEKVEAQFQGEATDVHYLDTRPVAAYSCVLRQRSPIKKLSPRQLFVLKWVRMCDEAGLIPVLTDSPYEGVLARCYVGGIQGSDPFKTAVLRPFGVQKPENNSTEFFEACIRTFSLPFDEVFAEVDALARAYLSRSPHTPMAEFARLNLSQIPERPNVESVTTVASPSAPPPLPAPPPTPSTELRPETTFGHSQPASIARKPEFLTELVLEPLYQQKEIPDYLHQTVVDFVEKEFSQEATTLVYFEDRGSQTFYHRMILRRAIGTLPARHLFVLKWLRMMDYASLIPALMDLSGGSYEQFMAQFYMAIMNGDSKAAVEYVQARSGGSWFEDNRVSIQEKCLFHFTPYFDNAFSGAVEMVNVYVSHFPDTGMAEWARRQLKSGSGGAWATSR